MSPAIGREWRNHSFPIFLVFLFCAFLPSLHADLDEQDAGKVAGELTAQEMAAELGRQAEERKRIEGVEAVSYQEILNDPDNLELNFKYARQQLLNNNFLGASATLERILMIEPDLAPVRLYFAIALYRLENFLEAEREFTRVLEMKTAAGKIRSQAEDYLKRVRKQRRHTRFIVRQTVGHGYDHNRNTASHAGVAMSNDVAFPLTGSSLRRSDTNFLTTTNILAERDFGKRKGNHLFASFTHFLQEQTTVDSLDLHSLGGSAGAVFHTAYGVFTPAFSMGHLFLRRETYLRTQALSLTAEKALGKRWGTELKTQFQRQDYQNTHESPSGEEREGPQLDTTGTVFYALTPTMRLSSTLGFRNKHAAQKYHRYQELLLEQSHFWLLGHGQFLINSLETAFDYYASPNYALEAVNRRDQSIRYRVTYGAPLTFLQIGKILPKPLQDIQALFTYEYYRTVSNVSSYTYRNYKFQFALSKTIEF